MTTATPSARVLPWAGASMNLSNTELRTADEALALAGLDWEVDVKPMYFTVREAGKEKRIRSSRRAVYRKDTFAELGVVGSKYVPFTNTQSFAFLDHLVANGEASFQAAGEMNGGSKIFVVMKTGPTDYILEDAHDTYVLFTASHDGSGSVTATTSAVRLQCTNMFRAAMASETPVFRARHIDADMKVDVEGMVEAARVALNQSVVDMEEFAKVAYQLVEVSVDADQAEGILKKAMPWQNPATLKEIDRIVQNMEFSETIHDEHRYTGWGLLNSVTEMLAHGRSVRTSDAGFKRAMGINSQIEARVVKALTR